MTESTSSASPLSRRQLLTAAGAASLAAAGSSLAEHDEKHAHHDHGVPKNEALSESALDCVKTGQDCMEHCLALLRSGDTSLAECASRVQELIVSCGALSSLAARGSKHLALFARAAKEVCADCEKECRKHAHHKPCTACAESCAACIKQCATFAA